MNPMNEVRIEKATVSIGVGEAGEKLSRAITLLEEMFDQTPVKTFSTVTNPEWGIRKRQPIACKLTLRGEKADKAIENTFKPYNILEAEARAAKKEVVAEESIMNVPFN